MSKSVRTLSFAIKLALASAVSLLACSTYYTLERLQNPGSLHYWAVALALPVSLLGLAGTAATLASGTRVGTTLWVSALAFAAPAFLFALTWL